MAEALTFRYAERKDTELILKFIRDLAKYEKMENELIATVDLLDNRCLKSKRRKLYLLWQITGKWVLPYFFIIFLLFWDGQGYILRIYLFFRNIGGAVMGKAY